jgi:hypothetical protein
VPTAHASLSVRANTPFTVTLLPGVALTLVGVQPPAADAALPAVTTIAPAIAPATAHFFR